MSLAAVVLAAGGSARLGRPKQLLPYRGATLLDAVLATLRSPQVGAAGIRQVVVALGGAADEVAAAADLSGMTPVHAPDFGEGCGASMRTAVAALPEDTDGIVVLLGDQPGVSAAAIVALVDAALGSGARVGATRYDDRLGHPLWFGRATFPDLLALRGDKAIWKLVGAAGADLVEVRAPGPVPADVDTEADYAALLRTEGIPGG